MRGIDNQSTMGAWVGKLVLKGASGGMTEWRYLDGPAFMHQDAEVKAARKD
jgi:branched-chain amino acid transport system substrate-binding protein